MRELIILSISLKQILIAFKGFTFISLIFRFSSTNILFGGIIILNKDKKIIFDENMFIMLILG